MTFASRWKSESGQMAIFVALIFQVLFVFFAMVINISLIVHDKIVLQNSVDLAAYYAAQKQAQVLNQMGHINYQIRQTNKLLAWRQWVLGDLGYFEHPLRSNSGEPIEDKLGPETNMTAPGICITHSTWEGTVAANYSGSVSPSNMCGVRSLELPPVPVFNTTLPLLPIADNLKNITEGLSKAAASNCKSLGPINWAFASKLQISYRLGMMARKTMFLEMAKQISDSPSDFRDIQGDSVLGGVEKVVRKNINQSQDAEVEILNSLALGSCANAGFVKDIVVNPLLRYADFDGTVGCKRVDKFVACGDNSCAPIHGMDPEGIDVFGQDGMAVYSFLQTRPMDLPEELRPTMGFEKNPWCMAYVGVKAKMTSRKPFGPFGQPVVLEARSYAKPFGGSIGPWYADQWPSGQDHSSGTVRSDQVAPVRELPGVSVSAAAVANFSRYPGDALGYASEMERGALRGLFLGPGNFGPGGHPLRTEYYNHLDQQELLERTGNYLVDSLTDSETTSPTFRLRQLEMTAVAPDLFDITYYPVEPDYFNNYLSYQVEKGLFDQAKPVSDLGSHFELPDWRDASVALQIQMVNPPAAAGSTLPYQNVFYKIRDRTHLLTWWAPKGVVDYGFPEDEFMNCISAPRPDKPTPGMCVTGGRVGYSVKLVHRGYLTSSEHRLGGASDSSGPLVDPPTAQEGW